MIKVFLLFILVLNFAFSSTKDEYDSCSCQVGYYMKLIVRSDYNYRLYSKSYFDGTHDIYNCTDSGKSKFTYVSDSYYDEYYDKGHQHTSSYICTVNTCEDGLYPDENGTCLAPDCPIKNICSGSVCGDTGNGFECSNKYELIDCNGDNVGTETYIESFNCFYPPADDNETDPLCDPPCEGNTTCINGMCVPFGSPPSDKNETDPHDCPMGEYWSFMANNGEGGCVPFFPDDNETDSDSNGGDSSDGSSNGTDSNGTVGGSDINGTSGGTDSNGTDDGFDYDGQITPNDYKSGMSEYSDKVLDTLSKIMDSYALVKLPVIVTGGCNSQLFTSFNILGKSYTVDLRSWFAKLDEYNYLIKGFVLFLFGVSGVMMVASGRGGE